MYPLSLLMLLSALYIAQADNSSLPPLPPPGAAPALAPDAPASPDAPEKGAEKKAAAPAYFGTDKPLSSGPPPGGLPGAASGLRADEPPRAPEKPKGPAAEVYYYKDEKGNLKAVDSLDAVPEKFRAKAKAVKKKD